VEHSFHMIRQISEHRFSRSKLVAEYSWCCSHKVAWATYLPVALKDLTDSIVDASGLDREEQPTDISTAHT